MTPSEPKPRVARPSSPGAPDSGVMSREECTDWHGRSTAYPSASSYSREGRQGGGGGLHVRALLARIELLYTYDDVIFLIAFLSSPYRETPKNALKKNR
jgi:hypothetical protein